MLRIATRECGSWSASSARLICVFERGRVTFDMNETQAFAAEVNASMQAWRSKATNIVLVVLAVALVPLTLLVLMGIDIRLPWLSREFAVLACAVLGVAAIRPRWDLRWRLLMLFTVLYALTAVQLAMTGLAGNGRIFLLMLPLLALVLAGVRQGWLALAVSMCLYSAFNVLAANGVLSRWEQVHENSVAPGYWFLEGLLLWTALIPLMILFTRFQAARTRTMVEERQARRQLEEETAARRLVEEDMLRVCEDEKQRIGSDLHDGLCQHLTAVLLNCTAVENETAARGAPEALPLARIRTLIEESIGMAYDAAKGLCPTAMTSESLASALNRLCRHAQESSGIACELCVPDPAANLSMPQGLHLYRIAQEAVANALKHSRCSRIAVELLHLKDALVLRIQDNGQAVSGGGSYGGGLGRRIMDYRARSLGGTLTVEHPAEGGTLVVCRVSGSQDPDGEGAGGVPTHS